MYQTYFSLPHRTGKTQKIQFSEIVYLEGSINYTLIHLTNGSIKISPRTLLFHINNSLNESFIRIHRSFCVNKHFIQSYEPDVNPDYLLLEGGFKLTFSRRKKKNLAQIIF